MLRLLPIFSDEALFGTMQTKDRKAGEICSAISVEKKKKIECYLCNGDHCLSSCGAFKAKSLEEERAFIPERELCYKMLLCWSSVKELPNKDHLQQM